jgi:hypothetical protein
MKDGSAKVPPINARSYPKHSAPKAEKKTKAKKRKLKASGGVGIRPLSVK